MSQNNSANYSELADTGSSQDRTRVTIGPPTEDRTKTGPVYVSDNRLKPGDVVGESYEIIELLGSGGMGSVFKVRHKILQKIYAMKTLTSEQVNETAWRRLQVEAQAIARMNHPNIVGIHNYGLHEGRMPFYVMDLLIGDDLADKLVKQGPLSYQQAIAIFIEVARGLAYAHKKGIVHRDIKPGNIVLLAVPDASGARVKVVDFGIAKLSGIADPDKQKLTSMGEIFGSPYYMSPEQCTGARIDTRSDIYSAGCTLFEALTGTPPFKGNNPVNTMMLHQTAAPPTLKRASGGRTFPEALEQLVARMLAKAPMDRYQSMERVAEDLASIARGEDIGELLFNTQNLSGTGHVTLKLTGQTDAAPQQANTSSKSKTSKNLALVFTTLALLATTAIFTIAYLKTFKGPKASHEETSTISPVGTTAVNPAPAVVQTEEAKKEEKKEKNAQTAKTKVLEPFSHAVMINGVKMREFRFPEQSLGFIGPGHHKLERVPAHGVIRYPYNQPLYLYTMPYMMGHMEFFRQLRADDIQYIHLCEGALSDQEAASKDQSYLTLLSDIRESNVGEALQIMASWTGLKELAIEHNINLTNQAYPYLAKLKGLENLKINHCPISGRSLAKLDYLKNLKSLEVQDCINMSPLIAALAGNQNIERLILSPRMGERFSVDDCKAIASCKNLRYLALTSCNLNNEQVEILATLPRLQTIILAGGKFDGAIIPSLKKMTTLHHVYMDSRFWREIDQRALVYPGSRLKISEDPDAGT